MQLTRHTDYALRVLIYLLVHDEEPGLASVSQIASAYGISANHLAKVAGELARQGWVSSKRGQQGGLALLPAARELSVGHVVRTLERNLELVECMGEHDTCPITPLCTLKGVLYEAAEAFFAVLDEVPLIDLTRHHQRGLRHLLTGSPLTALIESQQ